MTTRFDHKDVEKWIDCEKHGAQKGVICPQCKVARLNGLAPCPSCGATGNNWKKKCNDCGNENLCFMCADNHKCKSSDEVWDEALVSLIDEVDIHKPRNGGSDTMIIQNKVNELVRAVNKLIRP